MNLKDKKPLLMGGEGKPVPGFVLAINKRLIGRSRLRNK